VSEHKGLGIIAETLETEFDRLFLWGRWCIIAAQAAMAILISALSPQATIVYIALALLLLYNAGVLGITYRRLTRKQPLTSGFLVSLLALDLFSLFLIAYPTGASNSPFLGQCYLDIFLGALYFEIGGGLILGVASLLVTTLLVLLHPSGLWDDLRDLVPYFLIAGAFTGYLSHGLKTWFSRYQISVDSQKEQEVQVEVARREMALARRAQQAALPLSAPRVPGLDCAVRSRPAREIGGDLHLFISDSDHLELIIGDVSGKGIPASLTATSIAHLLPWLSPLEDASAALQYLNRDLVERLPQDTFVTLCLVETHGANDSFRICNAGHPPPLLWRSREQIVTPLDGCELPLGIDNAALFPARLYSLEVGDALVLYTDGMIEVRNEKGNELQSERLAEAFARRAATDSADEIADYLLQTVDGWGEATDDVTLIVCKRVPVSATDRQSGDSKRSKGTSTRSAGSGVDPTGVVGP
jgi:hypothetical protein